MPAPRLIVLCHAGGDYGMGHLMRCLAIAEEAVARGWSVRLLGDLSATALEVVARLVPAALVGSDWPAEGADVVHVDTYLDVELPAGPWLISNMQDGTFGVRAADLAIDANLGAETRFAADRAGHALVGVAVVPIRRDVRKHVQAGPVTGVARRALVVIGGTDPFGLTPRVVEGLAAVTEPLEVTVVTPEAQRIAVEEAAASSRHRVASVPFLADLPAVAAEHDLVISASGTSVWDFACMGVPMALICVTDNQLAGYRAVLDAELAVGLGEPPHDDLVPSFGALDTVVRTPADLDRLRERGQELVDGLGAWRIVSAWEQLLEGRTGERTVSADLTARRATSADARLLLDWRNDPRTRAGSREGGEIAWTDHVAWLERVLASANRQLWVVESAGTPVGTVRWDHLGGQDWEVSITVAPDVRGRGLAVQLLRAGEAALEVDGGARLIATVHRDNAASRRLFERAGYLPLTPPDADGFATSVRWRAATARPTSAGSRG